MTEESTPPSHFFNHLNYMDGGYLYMYTLDQIVLAQERLNDDIERELEVRSTHVLACILTFTRAWVAHLSTTQCAGLPRRRRQGCAVAEQGAHAIGADHPVGSHAHGVQRRRVPGRHSRRTTVFDHQLRGQPAKCVDGTGSRGSSISCVEEGG